MADTELRSQATATDGAIDRIHPSEAVARRSRIRVLLPFLVTLLVAAIAAGLGQAAWQAYMVAPWTRDGTVRAYVVTMAPQIAGRDPAQPRPGLVANAEFTPATAPWWKLLSAKKAADHLFLRYQVRDRGK